MGFWERWRTSLNDSLADFLSANPLLRADAAGTTTPGSPPGGSASQLKGRHVPNQLRASGSVCRRGCRQIPPWADMFGGWDVMIRGRIGDKESPATGAVFPMLAAGAALVQSAASAADAVAGDDQGTVEADLGQSWDGFDQV